MSKTAEMIGIVSGKGGVGKTNVVANLGVAAARRRARVLAVDGDAGLSNLDVLLGLAPTRTVADVLAGHCDMAEAITAGPSGLHVLAAASARPDLTALRPRGLAPLLVPLLAAKQEHDLILVDAGSGIAPTVLSLALACDRLILVTTPEPTALADAYATLKTLRRESAEVRCDVLINAARSAGEALDAYDRLRRVAERFLGVEPPLFGHVAHDVRLGDAVKRQQAVVEAFPTTRCAVQLRGLAAQLFELPRRPAPSVPAAHPVEV